MTDWTKFPTPEQRRIKALANAISALMEVPDETDSADYALALAKKLSSGLEAMSASALKLISPDTV